MKKISLFLFLGFLLTLASNSCTNTKTFAQELDDEQTLINAFVKRNNLNIVSTYPVDSIWNKDGRDIYYKSTSGLYFHLVEKGDTSKVELRNIVTPRYKQYDLTANPDTVRNWNTIDNPHPPQFIYGDMTQSCKAFQEAVSYMSRNESEAVIIVPFLLGFNSTANTTPYAYILKIKILK
ncbi:MAG: DUF4827 family protein [Paludibacter sp.]